MFLACRLLQDCCHLSNGSRYLKTHSTSCACQQAITLIEFVFDTSEAYVVVGVARGASSFTIETCGDKPAVGRSLLAENLYCVRAAPIVTPACGDNEQCEKSVSMHGMTLVNPRRNQERVPSVTRFVAESRGILIRRNQTEDQVAVAPVFFDRGPGDACSRLRHQIDFEAATSLLRSI